MKFSETQREVLSFIEKYQLETSIETRLLDLVSEIGELSKELLKGNNYGKNQFVTTHKWEEEFGDVLFSLICIANSTGINLEKSLSIALNKYTERFNKKGSISSNSK